MAMIKKGDIKKAEEAPVKVESGVDAAVERLQKKSEVKATTAPVTGYKQRDFDAEAHGKTRCACFNAALQSPAIAGLPFKNIDEFLALVKKAADEGVKYSFNE